MKGILILIILFGLANTSWAEETTNNESNKVSFDIYGNLEALKKRLFGEPMDEEAVFVSSDDKSEYIADNPRRRLPRKANQTKKHDRNGTGDIIPSDTPNDEKTDFVYSRDSRRRLPHKANQRRGRDRNGTRDVITTATPNDYEPVHSQNYRRQRFNRFEVKARQSEDSGHRGATAPRPRGNLRRDGYIQGGSFYDEPVVSMTLLEAEIKYSFGVIEKEEFISIFDQSIGTNICKDVARLNEDFNAGNKDYEDKKRYREAKNMIEAFSLECLQRYANEVNNPSLNGHTASETNRTLTGKSPGEIGFEESSVNGKYQSQ